MMLCREFKEKLEDVSLLENPTEPMKKHLETCESCAEEFYLELTLVKSFKRLMVDADNISSMSVQMRQVDTRLSTYESSYLICRIKEFLISLFSFNKLRYAVPVAVVAVLMLIFIKPENNHLISYYNLNLSGINREIALDNDLICELLSGLGLYDAAVDVCGCTDNCDLMIYDLKNEKEAALVVQALEKLNTGEIDSEIMPVVEKNNSIDKTT